ncbi:oxygenase MpaB family protein [Mycobacterium sp. URHB0044]|uniref:oxygenase MpaB family protein n=1 Tax=Mycobacterium sp. URHB0044 TaxID=1380386 RepID=UPI00068593F1|nr:oxygenase MpaB family protein [Mycobacterium sp. URHB0044]
MPQAAPPTAFSYFRNIDTDRGRKLKRRLEHIAGADMSLPENVIHGYGAAMNEGDVLSDAYINAAFSGPDRKRAREFVEQALNDGIDSVTDAPVELAALFKDLDTEPDWLDWDLVEHGAEVFRRYGHGLYEFFGMITFNGYRTPTVAKPLILTGAYTGGSAFGRFLETSRFCVDVSEPGALRAGGIGRRSAVMVRILHSIIRRTLLPHPEWDSAWLGMPLSQADSFSTLLASSFVPGQTLKLLGYRPTDHDILAMMHQWRYIGHLMGVQPAWYPETVADGFRAQLLILLSADKEDSADFRHLTQSFMSNYQPKQDSHGLRRLAGELNYRVKLGLAAYYVPTDTYRAAGLPDPGLWRYIPLASFVPNYLRETARRRIPGVAGLIDRRRRAARERWLHEHLDGGEAKFAPVEKLTR